MSTGRTGAAEKAALDSERRARPAWFAGACERLHEKYASLTDGAPADYIPEPARVEPDRFGISAVTADGLHVGVGDHGHRFTSQSISKLLVYGPALETHGRERVLDHVGVAPTGDRFNAIVLDEERNRATNPMVNAGAIAHLMRSR